MCKGRIACTASLRSDYVYASVGGLESCPLIRFSFVQQERGTLSPFFLSTGTSFYDIFGEKVEDYGRKPCFDQKRTEESQSLNPFHKIS